MDSLSGRRKSSLFPGCVAAFLYVAFLFAVAVTFVLPRMVVYWKDIGVKELPTSTQVMVDLSDFTKNRWYVLGLILLAAVAATVIALGRRRSG